MLTAVGALSALKSLEPPPEITYESLEEAKAATIAHAQRRCCKTHKEGRQKNRWRRECLYLSCSQSNPPIRKGPRQRTSSSRSTGRLFRASIRSQVNGHWLIQVACGDHNHDPSNIFSDLQAAWALTDVFITRLKYVKRVLCVAKIKVLFVVIYLILYLRACSTSRNASADNLL